MDAKMASWKVKRPPGSPPVFKARYVARGFSQRQGVDFFQTFSPTPKMTTLRVLLHVYAQRDYELHSLDFSTAFLQGSLHEEIWLRRPPGFTGSFPAGTQWSLRRPIYGLRQAPREWHDTLRTTLASLGFAPSTTDPSLFLRTDTTVPLFYVLVYVDDLVFATADTEALAHVKSELQKRHTCTDLGELTSYLGLQITRDRAQRTITLTQSHMVQQVLQRFGFTYSSPQSTPLPTGHLLSAPPSDESVEPSGPYPELVGCLITSGMGLVLGGRARVVLTGHADASWVDDCATCEAEIYAGAMAVQELRWLTYLLTDFGEAPRSPPQRGQLRLAYVASQANTADVFTKALQPCDHQPCFVILDWSCDLLFSPTLPMGDQSGIISGPLTKTCPAQTASLALSHALCPALRSARLLPCHAARTPPCPAARALPYPTARAPLFPAAHASPCPAARTPPCLAARASPYPAACASPCPAAPRILSKYPPHTALPCSPRIALPCSLRTALPCSPCVAVPWSPRAALLCSPRAALPCSPCIALPCSPRAALLYSPHAALPCSSRAVLPCSLRPVLQLTRPAASAPCSLRRGRFLPVAYLHCCPFFYLWRPSVQESLSPQQLREWAIWWGNPGGGASRARARGAGARGARTRRQETLLSQQLREWAVRWGSPGGGAYGATTGGTCESTPAGSADGGHGGASRYFFRDCPTVTPVTAPVAVTLADPSGGPVVARSSTILPCPAAPSFSLTGFHLPSFTRNLVATTVLHDQFVTVTQPRGELVAIGTDSRTREDLATFIWRPESGLYTLTTESAQVVELGQVAASVEVATSCSCRLITHQTLLWPHRLGHPSLPHLRGMHSRLLVSGLPRSLPPLPRSLAPPCLPCVEERQRAAPHSSSFPPAIAPLQTLDMDMWGPARVTGQGPAPSGVSQVDPPPLVEPLEVSSDTSGPAEGGHPTAAGIVAPRRSPCLAAPSGSPPRLSSSPLQRIAVDSGATRGGDTGGVGGAGAGGTGFGGAGGPDARDASAGGTGARRQETLLPEQRRERAVRWNSPGGGAIRARTGGAGTTGAGGAGAGGTGVGGAGGPGAGDASASGTGARRQETLSPERLRDWAVKWGSPGGGASRARAGGARARGAGGTGAGGTGAASARGAGAAGAGGARAEGAGGTGAAVLEVLELEVLEVLELEVLKVLELVVLEVLELEVLEVLELLMVQVLSLPSSTGLTPPLLRPLPDQSQPQLLPSSPLSGSQLSAPSPYLAQTGSLEDFREPDSRPASPVRTVCCARPPPVPDTHTMTLRPSSVPQHVALPSPPVSSFPYVPHPELDLARAASPTITRLVATVVTDPSFESTTAFSLVVFVARSHLDYVASLVSESESVFPPSVGGELALGCDILDDRQFELECLATVLPHFASMLLCPEGDLQTLEIPTPCSYAEAVTGDYSSEWQKAMDAEMALWKSTATYVFEVPPPGANIVDGMSILIMKRLPGSPPVFKARYVA
ncbi:unnamed protein product [Closterium sp. NIES-53]